MEKDLEMNVSLMLTVNLGSYNSIKVGSSVNYFIDDISSYEDAFDMLMLKLLSKVTETVKRVNIKNKNKEA